MLMEANYLLFTFYTHFFKCIEKDLGLLGLTLRRLDILRFWLFCIRTSARTSLSSRSDLLFYWKGKDS